MHHLLAHGISFQCDEFGTMPWIRVNMPLPINTHYANRRLVRYRTLWDRGHHTRQRMTRLLPDGRAHSTKPARMNMAGRPMKLDTGASGASLGGVG